MDLGTIIITLIFIAIVTAPFLITGYSRKRVKKYLFGRITEMAESEDCTISQHEFCSDFVIGLDGMANHLFFYKKVENLEFTKSVNLRKFKSCNLISTNRNITDKKKKLYVVDKLELSFYPVEKGTPEISIELYNDEYDRLTLTGELQVAEKWKKLLNERYKMSQKPKTGIDNQYGSTVSVPLKQKSRKPIAT
jgi:hypothetical protein